MPRYTSIPEAIEFPTDGGKTAHAFYYPPANRDFRGPQGEAPPLVVMMHGGPTSATPALFRLTTQFWTSRGFAVCDVNYGGSTGYGREYRNRLRDSWGVVDVADATNAALYLAEQGKADPQQAHDSRRQRRRLHDARLPGVQRRVPLRRQPVRRERSGALGARHAQVRVAVSRSARRPVSAGRGPLPRAVADLSPRRLQPAGDLAARAWRTRSCRRTRRS